MRTSILTASSPLHLGPDLALPMLGVVLLSLSLLAAASLFVALAF